MAMRDATAPKCGNATDRKKASDRFRYRKKIEADPDHNKKRYLRWLDLHPDGNKDAYRRSLQRDPEHNKKKHAKAKQRGYVQKRTRRKPRNPGLRKRTDARREYEKVVYQQNKRAIVERIVKRQKERYASDPNYVVYQSLRSRMRYALKHQSSKTCGKTMSLVGCTREQLVAHLESQFLKGMSWANRREWHIDHIIPVSAFDLTTSEGQQAAFHYTNLRPLWAKDNLAKSAKPPSSQHCFAFGYVALSDRQRARARKGSQGTERRRA
jgi:hypothetical protein